MQSSSFFRFVVSGVFVPVVAAGATGCAGRLTPDEVRALLDEPKGTVSALTLPTITRDLFVADPGGHCVAGHPWPKVRAFISPTAHAFVCLCVCVLSRPLNPVYEAVGDAFGLENIPFSEGLF